MGVFTTCYLESNEYLSIYEKEELSRLKNYFKLDKIELYKIIKEILQVLRELKTLENKTVVLLSSIIKLSEGSKDNKYLKNSLNKVINNTKLEIELKTENTRNNIINTNNINNSSDIENTNTNINDIKDVKEIKNIKQNKKDENIEDKENENLEKEVEKFNKTKIRVLDTLIFKKKMLDRKQIPLFAALGNAKMILEGNILKVDLSKEKSSTNLKVLNDIEALNTIKEVGKEITKLDIEVEYLF